MTGSIQKRAIIGIIFICVGTIFLLKNLGYDIEIPFIFSWPAVFVVIGLINFLSGNVRAGFIFFVLATVFYLHYYDVVNLRDIWPVILIGIGLSFLLGKKKIAVRNTEESADVFDEMAIFGGTEKKYVSENLQGGKITCLFGGSTIDFRGAKAQEGAQIDVFCMFGGVELIVPNDWKVKMDATAIFGGLSDERKSVDETSQTTVQIKGFTMFGGVEVKS